MTKLCFQQQNRPFWLILYELVKIRPKQFNFANYNLKILLEFYTISKCSISFILTLNIILL